MCFKSAVLDERAIVSMCVTDVNAGARAWVRPARNDAVSWVAQSGPQKWINTADLCVCADRCLMNRVDFIEHDNIGVFNVYFAETLF